MTIEIVMAQFGERASALQPSLDSFRQYFPEAAFVLYTDRLESASGVDTVRVVAPPYPRTDARYGNRSNDLYKAIGLLESKADVAIAVDSDMVIVADAVRVLPLLAERFGLCVPMNPRYTVKKDTDIGADSDQSVDETRGYGHAFNMSPLAFATGDPRGRPLLEAYCTEMRERPVRGPLALWRAVWATGFFPCLLPPQWCVCGGSQNDGHCGVGDEVILHAGHAAVRDHYGVG